MIWTSEKPTEAGWYWFRHREIPAESFIVRVNACGEFFECGSSSTYVTNNYIGEWAGPIPEPEERA